MKLFLLPLVFKCLFLIVTYKVFAFLFQRNSLSPRDRPRSVDRRSPGPDIKKVKKEEVSPRNYFITH